MKWVGNADSAAQKPSERLDATQVVESKQTCRTHRWRTEVKCVGRFRTVSTRTGWQEPQ